MLKAVNWWEGDKLLQVNDLVHYSDRLPGLFRARMKQLEAIHRWLGGYFEAVAIMLQIPGGAEYEWLGEGEDEGEDGARELVLSADRDMVFSILAEGLERLDAEALIHQVPGAATYKARKLPLEIRLTLAERDRNGVMNIVAECLDRLMVIPELDDEERELYDSAEPRPRWRRCWRAVVTFLCTPLRRRKQ